jgi:predicted Co/Zn/Cd cation transporter (cation efflux family)
MLSERTGLILSTVASAALAIFAFATAAVSNSQTVLLDGYYSLLTSACGLAALRVASLLKRPDNQRYPFGYAGFEPLLNLFRGSLVLSVTLYAGISAVTDLSEGGHQVANQTAALYAFLTTLVCFSVATFVGRLSKKTDSPLLEVDSESWKVDGWISFGICLAFLLGAGVSGWLDSSKVALIDSLTLLVLCAVTFPVPLRIVKDSVNQLVGAAPERSREVAVLQRVNEVLDHLPLVAEAKPRITQIGRELYLNLYIVLYEDLSVGDIDQVRDNLLIASREVEPNAILDVLFTRQPRWAAPEPTVRS